MAKFSLGRFAHAVNEQQPFTALGKNLGAAYLQSAEDKKIQDAKNALQDKLAGNVNIDLEATNEASRLEDEAKKKEQEASDLEKYGKFEDLGVQKQALLDEAASLRKEALKYKGHLDPYTPNALKPEVSKELFGNSYADRQKNAEEQATANEAEASKIGEIIKKKAPIIGPSEPSATDKTVLEYPKARTVSGTQIDEEVTGLRAAAKAAAEKAKTKKEEAKTLTTAETEKQGTTLNRIKALTEVLSEHPEAAKAGFGKEELTALELKDRVETNEAKIEAQLAKEQAKLAAKGDIKTLFQEFTDPNKTLEEKKVLTAEYLVSIGEPDKAIKVLEPQNEMKDLLQIMQLQVAQQGLKTGALTQKKLETELKDPKLNTAQEQTVQSIGMAKTLLSDLWNTFSKDNKGTILQSLQSKISEIPTMGQRWAPDEAAYNNNRSIVAEQYLRAATGAAAPDNEKRQYASYLPELGDTPKQAQAKMTNFITSIKAKAAGTIGLLRTQGKNKEADMIEASMTDALSSIMIPKGKARM